MIHISSLLLGLGNGGVFAALGVALVITFRSSKVVNFATGAIALFVAYTYAGLRRGELLLVVPGLPVSVDLGGELGFVPALVISLVVANLLGGLLYLVVFRPLREQSPLAQAVASLGVLVVLQGVLAIRVGTAPVSVAPIFPADRWAAGDVFLLSDRAYLVVTVLVITAALSAMTRFTRFGLLTRATAETRTGAFVSGVSPERVALANWMLSAAVAGVAGILIAPLSPLTPVTYTLFVIPALAAAVVGRFANLMTTALAAVGIGMIQAGATSVATSYSWMPASGSAELVPLIVLMVALLVTGHGVPARGARVARSLGHAPRTRHLTPPTVLGTAAGVVALLVTHGTWRAAVIGTFIAAIISLSLVVVTGYAGQVSLAQLTLAGVAAYSLSGMTQAWGVPFPLAPLAAAGVATVIGVLIGLPALRLQGLSLGVVTLAMAAAVEAVWFRNNQFVDSGGAHIEPPTLFGVDLGIGSGEAFPRLGFGLLCLGTLVAVAWSVARLRSSPLGSAMLAVRANERSAAGVGVDVVLVKVAAFAIASFIAGLGGSLLAYRRGVVTYDSFTAVGGLGLLSTAYLAGITSVWGGVNAGIIAGSGIVFIAMDRWVDLGEWFPVITGVLLVLTVIQHPEGVASIGHVMARRLTGLVRDLTGRSAGAAGSDAVAGAPAAGTVGIVEPTAVAPSTNGSAPADDAARPTGPTDDAAGPTGPGTNQAARPTAPGTDGAAVVTRPVLVVEGLSVRYGGVTAVADVSFEIAPGTIVGLIGPNGAGKTSLIDAVTGFAAASGTIELAGTPIHDLPPHRRVRAGLARTFQSLELYDDMTVEENVGVAARGAARAERQRAVLAALDRVGIAPLRDRPAGELSQGQRQLVSIARACVAEPTVLLLDEPAAGLDTDESAELGRRIEELRRTGAAILLVDHDVGLVLGVSDRIHVLDFGVTIAEGTPEEIRSSSAVVDAYLGTPNEPAEAGA